MLDPPFKESEWRLAKEKEVKRRGKLPKRITKKHQQQLMSFHLKGRGARPIAYATAFRLNSLARKRQQTCCLQSLGISGIRSQIKSYGSTHARFTKSCISQRHLCK